MSQLMDDILIFCLEKVDTKQMLIGG